MYFGSVRFFRHIILSAIALILAVSVGLAIFFGIRSHLESQKSIQAIAKYNEILSEDKLNIPQTASLEDVLADLKAKGYTTAQLIDALEQTDSGAMEEIFRNHFYHGEVDTGLAYTTLYPELYVTPPAAFIEKPNTVFLTFDDGPSVHTKDILSILEKYDIKATFFMSGSKEESGKALMKQVADAGHAIGVHSYSHNYNQIYASADSFLADFNDTYNIIYDATGVKPDICRFAGGSINSYDRLLYPQLIAETTRRGFVYYDWTVSGQDATGSANWTSIYNNVMNGIKGKDSAVILLHDTKYQTVTVLEDLIVALKEKGYTFDKLTHDIKPVIFSYTNESVR